MRNGELTPEEREEIRKLLLEDDDDDSIGKHMKESSRRGPTKRVFYLQKYFEENQGLYLKMKMIQDYMGRAGYPNSIKTIYRDLDILKENLHIQYDYQKKAYILPLPTQLATDISRIEGAMKDNWKISFRSFHYSTDRKEPKKYANKGEPITVSPWRTFRRNEKEYVYVFVDKKKGFRTYRIDRLDDITVIPVPRDGAEEYERDTKTDRGKKEPKVFNMYKGKKSCNVHMRFTNNLLDQVYDEFGEDVIIIRNKDGKHFHIVEPVSVSPTFYAWIATFGRSVLIEHPNEVIDGFKEFLHKSLGMYENEGET